MGEYRSGFELEVGSTDLDVNWGWGVQIWI